MIYSKLKTFKFLKLLGENILIYYFLNSNTTKGCKDYHFGKIMTFLISNIILEKYSKLSET